MQEDLAGVCVLFEMFSMSLSKLNESVAKFFTKPMWTSGGKSNNGINCTLEKSIIIIIVFIIIRHKASGVFLAFFEMRNCV